jgi:hypothetical protein
MPTWVETLPPAVVGIRRQVETSEVRRRAITR